MFGPGTSIYSTLFYIFALVIVILAGMYLAKMWQSVLRPQTQVIAKDGEVIKFFAKPVFKTIVIIAVLSLALIIVWNLKQMLTASRSNYLSPAEITEQQKVQEAKMPEREECDKARAEQKERAEIRPHKNVLNAFDEDMNKEAEIIKQRVIKK